MNFLSGKRKKATFQELVQALMDKASLGKIRQLVDSNPDILRQTSILSGSTALHHACHFKAPLEVVKFLVDRFPDALEMKDTYGSTPLHDACHFKAPLEVIQWLVDRFPGAVEMKDKDGDTPLHFACYSESPLEVISSPLHYAYAFFKKAPLEVVKLLVDQFPGAVEMKNNNGRTPLDCACYYKAPLEVIQLLVDRFPGAVEMKNEDGKTPLDYCDAYTKDKILEAKRMALQRQRLQQQREEEAEQRRRAEKEKAEADKQQLQRKKEDAMISTDRSMIKGLMDGQKRIQPVELSVGYIESIKTSKELGKGFFGVVFRGWDPVLMQDFAVKQIHEDIVRHGHTADVQTARETFRTELNTLLAFNHPNIACLYGYHLSQDLRGSQYLVFELAQKGSLDKFWENDLGRDRLSSLQTRVQIALDVVSALNYLHKGGDASAKEICFHRDIKPHNICLTGNLNAKLIDAGFAKVVAKVVPKGAPIDASSSSIVGHQGYRCPQYERGKLKKIGYQPACDIFSVGIVMAELLTGRLQNHKDDQGVTVDYYERYILDGDEIGDDIDETFEEKFDESQRLRDFANLALDCMKRKYETRPTAASVVERLRNILKQYETKPAAGSGAEAAGEATFDLTAPIQTTTCRLCDSEGVIGCKGTEQHYHCRSCMSRHVSSCTGQTEIRCQFAGCDSVTYSDTELIGFVSDASWSGFSSSRMVVRQLREMHSEQMRMHSITHGKLDRSLRLMTNLSAGVTYRCPRRFLLVAADRMSRWRHPRAWLRSTYRTKLRLYFVCAHSNTVVEPPIKIRVSKDWVDAIAPALALSLVLLGAAGKVYGFDVPIGPSEIAAMDDELKPALSVDDRAMLKRARDGQLTEKDVQTLDGSAFELVAEKVTRDLSWRDQVVPVEKDGIVSWVKKEHRHQYAY